MARLAGDEASYRAVRRRPAGVRRFPLSAFEPYELSAGQVGALLARLLAWAEEIEAVAR
jgi:hypothetical protein